jgi:hypothetical protein
MIRSRSSNEASAALSSPSARSEAMPPVPTLRCLTIRGCARKSPWKYEKPSARQRSKSSVLATPVGTSSETAMSGRPAERSARTVMPPCVGSVRKNL